MYFSSQSLEYKIKQTCFIFYFITLEYLKVVVIFSLDTLSLLNYGTVVVCKLNDRQG